MKRAGWSLVDEPEEADFQGRTLLSFFAGVLALSRRHDPLARGVAFGVVMGVSAIAIHSTVDFNLQIPANAFIFSVLLALGWLALFLERHRGQTPVDKSPG